MRKKIAIGMVMVLVLMGFVVMMNPAASHEEEDPFVTDLVVGRKHVKVGEVHVWNDFETLYVKYVITDCDWYLTETHLDIAVDGEDEDDIPDFPMTKTGNPIPGHFDYSMEHDYVKDYTYQITIEWEGEIGIAAHAVVKTKTGLDALEEALPDEVSAKVWYPAPDSYFETTISGDEFLSGVYTGWCIDTDEVIYRNEWYDMQVYSSYEELPPNTVEYPENLDLVNWIINQDYVGNHAQDNLPPDAGGNGYGESLGIYTKGDVQKAIWELIEDDPSASGLGPWSRDRVNEILAEAYANGEGYEPSECGDKVAIILIPFGATQITIAQVTFIEVGIPCGPAEDETAWAKPVDFPGANWAMYFMYNIQIYQEWPEGGTLSVAYEDLPLGGGNDWDYNDFVVDIDTIATYYGTETDRDLIRMRWTIRPEAKLAGYHHEMHLAISPGTFGCDGTYELYRGGVMVASGAYSDAAGLDVITVPDTNTPNDAELIIDFTGECDWSFPEWDDSLYHGENLFYDPYIKVLNTGQFVHTGDPRLITVPTDWQWPTPDATRIWTVYPLVGATVDSSVGPIFVPNWWTVYTGP